MRVCHFSEFDGALKGGIKSSIRQQREALDREGIDYTTEPSDSHDVLHLNVVGPFSMRRLLKANRDGTPIVYHVHSTVEDFRDSFRFSNLLAPLFDRYTRFLYSRADHLLPVSAHTERLLEEKGIAVPKTVVNNGFSRRRLDGFEELDGVRERYDIDDTAVVNLAMVFQRKGVGDFVKTAEELPDVDFRWFGERMNGLVTSRSTNRWVRRAPDNVAFTDYVDDVREAFAAGDIFFFPSYEEHQPIALIEAQYCGMPIVVRDIPQYEGWLEHGTHCLKGSSVEEFAALIERLRGDPELRAALGENARELAEQHTIDRIGSQLHDVYRSLA